MSRYGFFIALLLASNVMFAAETYQFNHENVLGTSFELKVRSTTPQAAQQAEAVVLAEIDRLCSIYSTYDPMSEVRLWLDGGQAARKVSPELIELLRVCESMKSSSNGAFDVSVGDAVAIWKQASKNNREPTAGELQTAIASTRTAPWKVTHDDATVERLSSARLTFDGIATGLIVDRVCNLALSVAGVEGVLIDIGGDLRIAGDLEESITIADPRSPANSLSSKLARIDLRDRAMTTSGNYQRGFQVGENGSPISSILELRGRCSTS